MENRHASVKDDIVVYYARVLGVSRYYYCTLLLLYVIFFAFYGTYVAAIRYCSGNSNDRITQPGVYTKRVTLRDGFFSLEMSRTRTGKRFCAQLDFNVSLSR